MSHIHSLGDSNSADRYQAYLERARAGMLARRSRALAADRGEFTFDSAIDPDRDADGDGRGAQEQAEDDAALERSDPAPESETSAAEPGPDESDGGHHELDAHA